MTSQHSGKVFDIAGGPVATGGGVILQRGHVLDDAPNQPFRFEHLPDGSYRIGVLHSNKALDASGGPTDNGAGLVRWDWHGGADQRWRFGVPVD